MSNTQKVVLVDFETANADRVIEVFSGLATFVTLVDDGQNGRKIVIVTSGVCEKVTFVGSSTPGFLELANGNSFLVQTDGVSLIELANG